MICCNEMPEVCDYGSSAVYRDLPTDEQIRAGVVPLDSLPAAWWNCMWNMTNGAINCARSELGVLINEICNVLVGAGVNPNCSCMDQLYQSIDKIRQTLATDVVAGAVKSSSCPSAVAIDACGFMSVNCLGNAASLTTTATTVVGAVNELKSTYDCCIGDLQTAVGGKAPTSHASDQTTYGVGNASCYGHVMLSDEYTCDLGCSGMAASQTAVACAYCCAMASIQSAASLGNTAGCALVQPSCASAGTCNTAARSDHTHPWPNRVVDSGNAACFTCFAYSCAAVTNPTYVAAWNNYELRAVCRACMTVGWANHIPTSQPDSANGAIWVC